MSGDLQRSSELRMRRARRAFEEEREREQSGTMREEWQKRRRGRRVAISPLIEQASAALFPLITLMTNLMQLQSHFGGSLFLSSSFSLFSSIFSSHFLSCHSSLSFIHFAPFWLPIERWYTHLGVSTCPWVSCPLICIKDTLGREQNAEI